METVLSTDKYLPLVALAKESGASFRFVYVTLRTPELAKARVAQRVLAGGHPVPEAAVVKRFHRSLDSLPKFAKLADEFWVYDNSDSAYNPDTTSTAAPVLTVHGCDGKVSDMDANCPVDMARRFLSMLR